MATEAEKVTLVSHEELIYRAVRDTPDHHGCDEQGKLLRLGTSAFNDPEKKPSVDRATLQAGGPASSRKVSSDGVVTLRAAEVRGVSSAVTNNSKGKALHVHAVDVMHVPEPTNYSHAQIESEPSIASDGAWKKLKEALCGIAMVRGWSARPQSSRS